MLTAEDIDQMAGMKGWESISSGHLYAGSTYKINYVIEHNSSKNYAQILHSAQEDDNYTSSQDNADLFAKSFVENIGEHLTPRIMKAMLSHIAKDLIDNAQQPENTRQQLQELINNI